MSDESISVALDERDYDRLMKLSCELRPPEAFVALGLKVLFRMTDVQRNALFAIDAFGNKADNVYMARNAARHVLGRKRVVVERVARKPSVPPGDPLPEDSRTSDAVLAMLADLDYSPIRHSDEEIERRIAEATGANLSERTSSGRQRKRRRS